MFDEVKASISISDVLSKFGYNPPNRQKYRIPCPLHGGDSDNFSVDDDKGVYHCFTCASSGSCIDLYAGLRGITPREAVDELSRDIRVVPINRFAAEARKYQAQVDKWRREKNPKVVYEPVITELEPGYRDLDERTIEHFRLGKTQEGVYIPHFGVNGQLIGWSIRRPDGESPKYKNSPGNMRCVPFGLFLNRRSIINSGSVIILEGQFDCIKLWQNGIKNVVALMGSSLTEDQAHLLLTVTTKLIVMLDGDEAGRNAAAKIKEQWSAVFDIVIVDLPDGVDPDEYFGKDE